MNPPPKITKIVITCGRAARSPISFMLNPEQVLIEDHSTLSYLGHHEDIWETLKLCSTKDTSESYALPNTQS